MIKYVIEKDGKYWKEKGLRGIYTNDLQDAELFEFPPSLECLNSGERWVKVSVKVTVVEYVE